MKTIVSLKKNLGRKKYNDFVDNFLKKGLILKVRRSSPEEFPEKKARELSELIAKDGFKIDEYYVANVSDGLSINLIARFENGYTMSAFGKFLRANSHKLERGSTVEDFLKSNYFTGSPAGFYFERLGPDEAFRCTEFLDVALDPEGRQAIPSKEALEKLMGEYCTLVPDKKIKELLKEEKYVDYFRDTFFEAKHKEQDMWQKEGFEDIVKKFSALGAELDKQPKGIVHNDLHRKNLVKIVSAPSSPKIIDWDEAVIGAIQKDLFRINMSVYEHNCVNAKDARDASIRKLYNAIQEAQKLDNTSRQKYTDTLEQFTRKYLITDALENLNFTAIAVRYVKKYEGRPNSDFYRNLRDLVFTRALDTLNELGETDLEERMTEFGKQNGLTRWDKETRANYEKTVHPDLLIGELRANEELSEEAQNEQAFLFNQAAKKRIWKRRGKLASALLSAACFGSLAFSYLTTKYLIPLTNIWEANSYISAKNDNTSHDELHEVLISRPEEIKEIEDIRGNLNWVIWNPEEPETERAKEIVESYKEKRDKIYQNIDDSIARAEDPHKNLLTENILSIDEREQIATEYLRLLAQDSLHSAPKAMISLHMDDIQKNMRAGLFTPETLARLEFIKEFELEFMKRDTPAVSQKKASKIQTPEDLLAFFKNHNADPAITMLLQTAVERHNNSPVTRYERIKALPTGTLDTLIFASLFDSKLDENLRNYVSSLGHDTELLKQDEYFVGYLASYAAKLLEVHKDFATVLAIMTNGEKDVENAMICADSKNFFTYSYRLKDEGNLAETAWHYFTRKNLDSNPGTELLLLRQFELEREGNRMMVRSNAILDDYENIADLLKTLTGSLEQEVYETGKVIDEASIGVIRKTFQESKENYELVSESYASFERYLNNPRFMELMPEQAAELREAMPTMKRMVDHCQALMQYSRTMINRYEDVKDCRNMEERSRVHDKYIGTIEQYAQTIESLGMTTQEIEEFNAKMRRLAQSIENFERRK